MSVVAYRPYGVDISNKMALLTGNKNNNQKKFVEGDDTSEDSDSSETGTSCRGSIENIDCVYEYSASSSNSFDNVEYNVKEENKKTDDFSDTSFQGTTEEIISRTLWDIESRLTLLENHIQSTSFALPSAFTGWDLSRKILVSKSLSSNAVNMCNHNSSFSAGVSSQGDSHGTNVRSKYADRVFRPASLLEADAYYCIAFKDGVDPETYSYIPLNGCYAAQKNLVREGIRTQKGGRKGGSRGLTLLGQTEEAKPSVQAENGNLRVDLDFARSQSDYLLRQDSSPRIYPFLANQVHAVSGELFYMKDVSKEYVVIPPVCESSNKNKKVAQPPSKVDSPAINQGSVNENQSSLNQPSDNRSIENAYRQLVQTTKKPNSQQNERISEEGVCEPEHRHPPSAGNITIAPRKPLKQLDKVERFKSAPVGFNKNPLFLVTPAFLDDYETNGNNNISSTGPNAKTTNEAVKKTTPSRSMSGRNLPFSCFDNLTDNPSNKQPDSFGLPEVIGSTANAVKRPILKPGRGSARESHKASVVKGKTNSATAKVGQHSDRTTNQISSTSQAVPNFMPFPSIRNFAVVTGTKLNAGAFTISKIL